MSIDLILIPLLAVPAAFAQWRLLRAGRCNWDGDIEDLLQDVVIRRLAMAGTCIVAVLAVALLRGPVTTAIAAITG